MQRLTGRPAPPITDAHDLPPSAPGRGAGIADRDGQRVVLRPIAGTGTATGAQGDVRPFSQEHPRHDPGPATACAFAFQMGEGAGAVTPAGQGEFLAGPG